MFLKWKIFQSELIKIQREYPKVISEVRGLGLLIGLNLKLIKLSLLII